MLPQCAVAPLGARQDPWSQPKLSGAIFSSRQRQHLCPFWTPILDLALGAENFGIFTLGAEAAFIGAWLNSLIQILTGSQRRHFRGWKWSAPLIERHARCNQRRARGMMTSYFWMTWLFWDNLMGRAFHIGHLTPTKGWLGTKQTIFRKFAESFRIGWTPLWIWKVMLQRTMLVRIIYHR